LATLTAPWDGRPQFSFLDLAVSNYAFGRPSLDEVQQIGPDRYILPNAWPAPRPSVGGFSSSPAASQTAPEVAPKSSPGARAVWPNLR
jgi:hypothetical protein